MSTNHNWRVWHWPWHSVTKEDYYQTLHISLKYVKFDNNWSYYSHFAGIGPFQWHWYSSGPGLFDD